MEFDWGKCVICRQRTSEHLKCPLHSCRRQDGAKFLNLFLENVIELLHFKQRSFSRII